jgi:FkbM family methyltransferase
MKNLKISVIFNLVSRALKSLTNVYIVDDKFLDFILKVITFYNLLKKIFSQMLPFTNKWAFVRWPSRECVARCTFDTIRYNFFLAKGYEFNVYLNPFFHEYDVIRFVSSYLHKGDIFIDVGAYAGLYTLIAGIKVGSSGKVISFEPNPLNFIFLKRNIELNKLNNVIIIQKAVGDKSGKLKLQFPAHSTALSSLLRMGKWEKRISVESTTIDDVVSNLDLNFVKILKVDAEGYEFNVLKGGLNTLARTQYILVEQNTPKVRQILLMKGFQLSTLKLSGYLLATNKFLKR